jgi:hypothetical protein
MWQIAVAQNEFQMTQQQFDSWLTSGSNVRNQSPAEHLKANFDMRLQEIDVLCKLSDEQRDRLQLAGDGDIARFERRVAAVRQELVGKTFDNNEIGDIYSKKISPLNQAWQRGVFGDESLFSKILATTLEAEQSEQFEKAMQERRARQHTVALKVFVAKMERAVPMTAAQRNALVDLLNEHSEPPLTSPKQQYAQYFALYHFSLVPEKDMKEIFDEEQLTAMQQTRQQGQQYKRWLQQHGLLPAE